MPTKNILTDAQRDAILSACGVYRYWLMRRWAPGPVLLFVMINPSTADARVDDNTIKRCASFAHAHGFGAMEVVNLYAFRATKVRALWLAKEAVGPLNDGHIEAAARDADAVCLAWGAKPKIDARVQQVIPLLRRASSRELQCLRITRSGYPEHPLMLPGSCRLQPFNQRTIEEAMTA